MVYLTVRQVAERTGLPLTSIRSMMSPAHPEFIPNVNVPTANGRPRYRIAEGDLEVWLDRHSVRAAEYDPQEDADSEVGVPLEEPPGSEDDYVARKEQQYMADAEWRGLSDNYPPDPRED